MPIQMLGENPMFFLVWVLAILVGLSIHEFSHALAGHALGDSTAEQAGRLTLNPIAHIDPIGFLMLLFIGFGWGKPVPYNPHNLKYPRWGPMLVGIAGPIANLVGVVIAGIALKFVTDFGNLPPGNLLVPFLVFLVRINIVLMLFNLIPVPPLDGSRILLSILAAPKYARIRFLLETRGPILLIGLIILDSLFGLNIFGRLFQGVIGLVFRIF